MQLQIIGALIVSSLSMTTLHHQITYRLQDHALNLPLPGHFGEIVMIIVERENDISIIL